VSPTYSFGCGWCGGLSYALAPHPGPAVTAPPPPGVTRAPQVLALACPHCGRRSTFWPGAPTAATAVTLPVA
jgi:hypothetical protein